MRASSLRVRPAPADHSASRHLLERRQQEWFTYGNNGTVTFPAAAFPSASPYLTNTSDTIDGGAGTNTVVYRSASSYYTVTKQPDGSWVVVSGVTAEGPDTLKNIQSIQFSDKTIPLSKVTTAARATTSAFP
jgi:hypothetical protein